MLTHVNSTVERKWNRRCSALRNF